MKVSSVMVYRRIKNFTTEFSRTLLRVCARIMVIPLVYRALRYSFKKNKITFVEHVDPIKRKVFELVEAHTINGQFMIDHVEAYQLYAAVRAVSKVEGDCVELGVAFGGSAKIICEAKANKKLHLFDTFSGTPYASDIDVPWFGKGQFKYEIKKVQSLLSGYSSVHFHEGIFPATAVAVAGNRFSFVHLDADVYKSMLDALEFFYPRINQGGIILAHDYNVDGVRLAFEEFFRQKPEPVIPLAINQCLVVKL